jgi:hypothetical protein
MRLAAWIAANASGHAAAALSEKNLIQQAH